MCLCFPLSLSLFFVCLLLFVTISFPSLSLSLSLSTFLWTTAKQVQLTRRCCSTAYSPNNRLTTFYRPDGEENTSSRTKYEWKPACDFEVWTRGFVTRSLACAGTHMRQGQHGYRPPQEKIGKRKGMKKKKASLIVILSRTFLCSNKLELCRCVLDHRPLVIAKSTSEPSTWTLFEFSCFLW